MANPSLPSSDKPSDKYDSSPYRQSTLFEPKKISDHFSPSAQIVFAQGDSLEILTSCPSGFAQLIITSPPYNIGKAYESKVEIKQYLEALKPIVEQMVRVLSPRGSLCW